MSLFCFVLLVFPLSGAFPSEPKCSKYDYEEKTLERTIRMEYAVERMLEENKAVERRIADSLNTLQNEQKQMQVTQLLLAVSVYINKLLLILNLILFLLSLLSSQQVPSSLLLLLPCVSLDALI